MANRIRLARDLPGGVALPGGRRRRSAAYVVVTAGGVTERVRAPGLLDVHPAPGLTEIERRGNILQNMEFLRGLVARLLQTATWPALAAFAAGAGLPEVLLYLVLLMDGISFAGGLQVQWIRLRDPAGAASELWDGGLSPFAFYFAERSTWYRTREAAVLRVDHLNAVIDAPCPPLHT